MSTQAVRGQPGERGYPTCAHCGQVRHNRPRGRFCGPACRQRAYRRRRKGDPETKPPSAYGAWSSPTAAERHARDLPRYGTAAG